MKILVTGVAGFIGSHVAERFLARGHRVVGVDNFDDFYDPDLKRRNLKTALDFESFAVVPGDIRDASLYARLARDFDAVVHLAARAGVRPSIAEPERYVDVNVRGTTALLEFMRRCEIPRLLFGSSSSVYGDDATVPFNESEPAVRPISPYAATKRAGELLVHSHAHLHGIDAVSLRFFTVYGPRQRPDLAIHKFARLMQRGDAVPMYGDGSSARDYTFIQDIVDGIEGALDHLSRNRGVHEIVNLGGARTVRLIDMISSLARILGVTPRIERRGDQPGDVRRTAADIRKAERLFGYRPSVPFADGLERFVGWLHAMRDARSVPAAV